MPRLVTDRIPSSIVTIFDRTSARIMQLQILMVIRPYMVRNAASFCCSLFNQIHTPMSVGSHPFLLCSIMDRSLASQNRCGLRRGSRVMEKRSRLQAHSSGSFRRLSSNTSTQTAFNHSFFGAARVQVKDVHWRLDEQLYMYCW